VWLLRVVAPRHTLHALAGSGVMAGVLAACSATHVDLGVLWLGHHVLTFCWLVVAAGVLPAAWVRTELVPRASAIGWVLGIGTAVAVLALGSGWADPFRPYWPRAVVLGVSVLLGGLALWTRRGE